MSLTPEFSRAILEPGLTLGNSNNFKGFLLFSKGGKGGSLLGGKPASIKVSREGLLAVEMVTTIFVPQSQCA